tara:strand:- start:711 stop:1964 length:1254 start_codon:yes stop_codon:yes gene_type:complete
MTENQNNKEIDLIDIIINIINNKYKIIVTTLIFIGAMFLYLKTNTQKSIFISKTEIKPVSVVEEDKFTDYNYLVSRSLLQVSELSYLQTVYKNLPPNLIDEILGNKNTVFKNYLNKAGFRRITSSYLNDMFIESLVNQGLGDAVKHFSIIKKENYVDKKSYENAVNSYVSSSIKLYPPNDDEEGIKDDIRHNWFIEFKSDEQSEIRSFLEYLQTRTNQLVKEAINKQVEKSIITAENIMNYEVEDLNAQIENALTIYEVETVRKLAFLEEQASIARALDLKKNTLESKLFVTDSGVVATIGKDVAYYLRGYEMIEREMDLIKSRKNKKAFVENIAELEKQKQAILKNNEIQRIKALIPKTPLGISEEFSAGKMYIQGTKFSSNINNERSKFLIAAGIIGFLLSISVVIIRSAIISRK